LGGEFVGNHKFWTDEEKKILCRHYPQSSWDTLLKELPGRSRIVIASYAGKMGLRRGMIAIDKKVEAHHQAMIKKYFGADAISDAD
jgi:hypothetical protein